MNDKEQELDAMLNWYEWHRSDLWLNISLVLIGIAVGVMFMMILMLAGV